MPLFQSTIYTKIPPIYLHIDFFLWTLSARDRGATENPVSDLELKTQKLGSLKYLYNIGVNKRPLVSGS